MPSWCMLPCCFSGGPTSRGQLMAAILVTVFTQPTGHLQLSACQSEKSLANKEIIGMICVIMQEK